MADRGPAYRANTPDISEQEKEWHYQHKSRVVAREQEKERNLRRELAALPEGERQRAVLIAAFRLAELQLNLQSPHFQSQWADGVDPKHGTAAILLNYTMSLSNLASDAGMPAATECHMFEAARLRRLALGETLQPARPCREAAYGEKLIDATTAAGDRAIPQSVKTTINNWTMAVVARSLAVVAVDGLVRIKAMPKTKN
jgi:hypothetical protein